MPEVNIWLGSPKILQESPLGIPQIKQPLWQVGKKSNHKKVQYSKDIEGENIETSATVKLQNEELKYGCQGALGLNSRVMGGPDPGFHYTERGHIAD